MKRYTLSLILGALFFCGGLNGQLIESFGPVINVSFPTEELSATHDIGYEVGAQFNIDLGSKTSLLHVAAYFNYFAGKVYDIVDSTVVPPKVETKPLPNYDLIKIVLGGKFYNKKGFYIMPGISLAIDTNYERIGAELGAGYRFKLIEGILMEPGIKLAVINILGKEEYEITSRTINLGFSILF